ncbi:MAG: transposase [Deltaproteobacteria bacterium]|nr:transposase [Deltaproteobacteria bacterium]
MELWIEWWSHVRQLRPAFTRTSTFMWFAVALAAMCVRGDQLGVTSFVRALGLQERCYDRLLDFFHSRALRLDALTRLWVRLVLATLKPWLYTVQGRIVLVADGIKVAKTGRKMPAVKKLHQESDNNTKPEFIFGHSCQAVGLIVRAAAGFLAIPLACRIHEGVVFSNRDHRSLLDKLVLLVKSLAIDLPYYMIADTYYAAANIIRPLLKAGQHLVAAVRSNAVAYEPAPAADAPRRGRPRIYGNKIKLKTLFKEEDTFTSATSPVYAEKNVTLRYRVLDLLWRPVGSLVRFVLVDHPTRGRKILLCTDLSLSGLQIIELFGVRFKIEVSFKQAIYTLGTYAYHFWMSAMTPRPRRSGNQYLHRKPAAYRDQVRRKIAAYHAHIQLGIIAQGLLQTLALRCTAAVWKRFGSWLRTIRPDILPSEFVVAIALRHSLPLFLADSPNEHILVKFIRERIDLSRHEGAYLAAA